MMSRQPAVAEVEAVGAVAPGRRVGSEAGQVPGIHVPLKAVADNQITGFCVSGCGGLVGHPEDGLPVRTLQLPRRGHNFGATSHHSVWMKEIPELAEGAAFSRDGELARGASAT